MRSISLENRVSKQVCTAAVKAALISCVSSLVVGCGTANKDSGGPPSTQPVSRVVDRYQPDPNQTAEHEWDKVEDAKNPTFGDALDRIGQNFVKGFTGTPSDTGTTVSYETVFVPASQQRNHADPYVAVNNQIAQTPGGAGNFFKNLQPNNDGGQKKSSSQRTNNNRASQPVRPQSGRSQPGRTVPEVVKAPVRQSIQIASSRSGGATFKYRPVPGQTIQVPVTTVTFNLDPKTFAASKATEDNTYELMSDNLQVPDDAFAQFSAQFADRIRSMTPKLGPGQKLVLVLNTGEAAKGRVGRPAPADPATAGGPPDPVAQRRLLMRSLRDSLVDTKHDNGWVVTAGTYDQAMKELDDCRANPNAWIDITGQAADKSLPAQFDPDRMFAVSMTDVHCTRTDDQVKNHQMSVTLTLTLRQVSAGQQAPDLMAAKPFSEQCIYHPARQEYITMETDQSIKNRQDTVTASAEPVRIAGR